MKKLIPTLLLLYISNLCVAQELKQEYQVLVKEFIEFVKVDNIDSLKTRILYPINRDYPLSDIKNEKEFNDLYNLIFDEDLKNEIIKSNSATDWSSVGWRGIMLNNGTLWLDYDGKLISINYHSKNEKDERIKLIKKDKELIHEKIKNYQTPILIATTDRFKIRIDELENEKFRYVSWSVNSEMSVKPDLILTSGKLIRQGNGGNHFYEFINGNYRYELHVNVISSPDASPAELIVYKDDVELISQSVKTLIN